MEIPLKEVGISKNENSGNTSKGITYIGNTYNGISYNGKTYNRSRSKMQIPEQPLTGFFANV